LYTKWVFQAKGLKDPPTHMAKVAQSHMANELQGQSYCRWFNNAYSKQTSSIYKTVPKTSSVSTNYDEHMLVSRMEKKRSI